MTLVSYQWQFGFPLLVVIIAAVLSVKLAQAGNTTCVSHQLDWYTSVVGESPCMTYQRLRQICNKDYQVPNFSSTVPGDRCDDQVSTCCCNTIAFQLSMLCMNCQQDTQDVGGSGTDALQKGTYDVYRQSCSPAPNHTLPNDIQAAICNENIRIDDFLYDGWDDGTWFYVYTMESAEKEHAANNNNTFTHCPVQILQSYNPTSTSVASTLEAFSTTMSGAWTFGTPISSPSSTAASGAQSKSTSHASLIGGVVGGVLFIILVLAAAALKYRKMRAQRLRRRGDQSLEYEYSITPSFSGAPANRLVPNRSGVERGSASSTAGIFSNSSYRWSQASQISTEPSLRHHDAGPIVPQLTRSNESGRLPPAYDASWSVPRQYEPCNQPTRGFQKGNT